MSDMKIPIQGDLFVDTQEQAERLCQALRPHFPSAEIRYIADSWVVKFSEWWPQHEASVLVERLREAATTYGWDWHEKMVE